MTANTTTNAALDALRHHVSGAIERGEAEAIVERRVPAGLEQLVDTTQCPGGMGLGVWTRLDDLTRDVAVRALRKASRDHAFAREYGDLDVETVDGEQLDHARELRYDLERRRHDRHDARYPLPTPLPWQACRIVGVADPDPFCPDDVLFVAVRYADRACAGYGVRADGSLHCYWN